MGSTNELVPDASSEHPIVISRAEDQPVCAPDITIKPFQSIKVLAGYEAIVLTHSISEPTKMLMDRANHLLVISASKVLYSVRMDKCGNANVNQILLHSQINEYSLHSVAQYGDHLYVATHNSVWQFPYSDGQHTALDYGVVVLRNIQSGKPNGPSDIAIDPLGRAYIPRTLSELNENLEPTDALIKKFNFRRIPQGGYDYNTDGEIHSTGANTHGFMNFDTQARLWGIEKPLDDVYREDMGGDISINGVAEELNLYEFPTQNYGFPYCFTEYDLSSISIGKGMGAQWGHPMFMNDSLSLDDYCQSESNSQRPSFTLPPSSNAVDLQFYMGDFCSVGDLLSMGTSVGLPCNWTDTPLVAYHGYKGQPMGHNVVHLGMDDLGHQPRWDKKPEVLFEAENACTQDTSVCMSPSGLAMDTYGRVFIASDTTNEIFRVSRVYNPNAAQELTDRDNQREADKDAAADAKEDAEREASDLAQEIADDLAFEIKEQEENEQEEKERRVRMQYKESNS
ncbi:hypothetical protein BDF14DRAFT_1878506 [Spinellus fusiger]|nr:hypothetical protein BDF14DRAFT_1878506 [Spinellus fusiger]